MRLGFPQERGGNEGDTMRSSPRREGGPTGEKIHQECRSSQGGKEPLDVGRGKGRNELKPGRWTRKREKGMSAKEMHASTPTVCVKITRQRRRRSPVGSGEDKETRKARAVGEEQVEVAGSHARIINASPAVNN